MYFGTNLKNSDKDDGDHAWESHVEEGEGHRVGEAEVIIWQDVLQGQEQELWKLRVLIDMRVLPCHNC